MGHFVGYASGCWELVKQPYSAYLVKSRIGMVTVWSHTVSVKAEKAKFQVAIVPCYFPLYMTPFYTISTSSIHLGKWEDWPHPKAAVLWGTVAGAGASTRRHNLIGWWHLWFQTTSADGFRWGLLYNLVGGLEHFLCFHWEFHNPDWLIFFRGVETINQMDFDPWTVISSYHPKKVLRLVLLRVKRRVVPKSGCWTSPVWGVFSAELGQNIAGCSLGNVFDMPLKIHFAGVCVGLVMLGGFFLQSQRRGTNYDSRTICMAA